MARYKKNENEQANKDGINSTKKENVHQSEERRTSSIYWKSIAEKDLFI